ncbi:interferon gamma receptor 2 [Denticeps clupeoides]|uniref:Interferon/interleukin receptor domain-containing protein n=1 Tax=Denticeps clupeoides TaxID=299321 RepID=A0AAY4AS36_9TELE|nr:interleukin-10 receptor subunit beta-like [Denticeps clupeoides]
MTGTFRFFLVCFSYAVLCEVVAPWQRSKPTNVRLHRKEPLLMWQDGDGDSDSGGLHTSFVVQYADSKKDHWKNVPGCVSPSDGLRISCEGFLPHCKCDFSGLQEELYGAWMRVLVQGEMGNNTTLWTEADQQVQCIHYGSCVPEMILTPGPDSLTVEIKNRDSTLWKEYNGFLRYQVYYGREGGVMEVCHEQCHCTETGECGSPTVIPGLIMGERYCVQVQYLVYHKPYSNRSEVVCELIPETPAARELRIAVPLVAVFSALLSLSIGCFCLIIKNHKKVKHCLRPSFALPDHFYQFFSKEFSQEDMTSSSPAYHQPYEVISTVEELDEGGPNSGSMEDGEQEEGCSGAST